MRQEMIELLGWNHRTMSDDQYALLSRMERIVEIAVLRERQACAALVDANVAVCKNNSMLADVLAGNAAAIRARGIA